MRSILFLQENRRVSRSSLDHFTEYEQQTLFDLKGRAYTVSGLEEGKESEEREGGEDKMMISASDVAECQPTKEPTPSDNTSGNSTPRQRRKRRSAAERRESHRRRSSAVVKDAVHLAKVLNGLPQQKQKHENDKSLDPCLVHCQPFSPIPDYSETENDEANLHEPPEPSVHAPGDEDEIDEEFDFISRLNGETAEKFGGRTEVNSDKNALLQNSLEHRRSISADHLLHGIGLRREMLLLDTDQAEFADAIQIKMRSPSPHAVPVDDKTIGQQRHIEVEKVTGEKEWGKKGGRDLPDASHLAKRTAAVSLRPQLLTQIEKQRHLCNDNGRPSTCSSFTPSVEVRCAFHPNDNSMKGVSIAEVADSLSGPEQSFHIGTSRWEKEMNRSSKVHQQQLQQRHERKTKSNCKRRNSSVSTLSAPCAHSIPTSSNVLLNLVDRFVTKRQYSDSNLLKHNMNKSTFGENFCRRSFKWNLFWGRKDENSDKCTEKNDLVDELQSSRRKSEEDKDEAMRDYRKKSVQQRKSIRLGTLMEEMGEDRDKKKRQFGNGAQPKTVLSVHEEETHSNTLKVRIRNNNSLGPGQEAERSYPTKSPTAPKIVATQRFSLIGACDLTKLEEAEEGGMATSGGVRRTTSLKEKYRVREEDSLKLDMFLKEKRMSRTAEQQEDGQQSDDDQLHLGNNLDALHFIPVTSGEGLQNQQQNLHNLSQNSKKMISSQLDTIKTTSTTLTMPRKKNHCNIPRKSSISFQTNGTLKRKKGIGKAQLARRRSSYVTKAQILMAKSKMHQDSEQRNGNPKDEAKEKGVTKKNGNGKRQSDIAKTETVTLREGAKLLAKQRGASVSSSSLRQLLVGSERKASRGSKVAPKTNGNTDNGPKDANAEKERTEKDKKRESKANSALLGTIWSIRPRRKKEGNRSLANLFCQQSDSKFGKEEKPNDDSGPLDVHLSDSPKKLTLAQSPSSAAFSFEQIPDFVSVLSPAIFSRSQLNDSLWDDLNIWEEEETSWAAKFPTESLKLENGERKRQNIIYELMMTEKNHCQVLVLLRQVYQEGLIRNGILDKGTVRKLVPEVLDTLLDFHLNLLRRFRILSSGEAVVRDISDVICEVFVDSQIRHALFAALLAQKAIVRKFFEFHESEHKDRSFKDCMLLVAQRLTKYPILIEQILKYESLSDQKLKMQKAHFAVKSFASEINDELLRHERKIQWEAVKKALEKGSTGKLIDPKAKQDFTYADLVEPIEEAFAENEWGRKVHLVQRVFWRETMTSPDVELRLLLCDDIIVFLRPKGTSIGTSGAIGGMGGVGMERKEFPLQFFRHNSHSGVLPLFNTLVKGENLRRKSLLLIVTDKEQPDLIQLAFPTSPEMEQCVHAIKQAKTNAPKFVRLSKRRIFELSQRSIGEGTSVAEKEYQTKMDNWQRELEKIFAAYSEDSLLANYFECRMTFFDSVRSHLCRCPMRTFLPCEEQQQKQRIAEREKERLSALLKAKFDELARKRNGALANLVERAQRARDADLPSFFDDLYDLGAAGDTPSQSSSGSDDQFNQIVGSSDSCENQTKIAEGGGKKKPRRVRTYHGHESAEQKSLSGSSASSAGGVHPIRRHTTVPAGGHHVESSEEEDGEMDNEIRKLPQKMNPLSRKAATEIIRDNVRLRSQNDRLKKESALKDLQLVSLRSRKSPSGETPERLESLRQKQEELQAEKKAFLTECKRREEEFRAKCAGKETKLRTMEDELRERADEFARMRAELEKLKREREAAIERSTKYVPNTTQDDPPTVRTPPTKATTNSPMRISNTYCGAGPIPRSSADLPQQRQQNCSGAECSFRSQTPQLAERRAISQMELPRHLVVKTETKQADKVRKMRKN
ncbi:hypothetical protein niasHT_022526 [Heterodera trifolii]|uniref:DH domain-containing protein n=1 Tax=Heterodera trifolii TaxID=157864 RepID=A0ABD2JR30_9BILA